MAAQTVIRNVPLGDRNVLLPCEVESARSTRTVLLADDEDAVREVMTRLLEALGCEVVAARDGFEAVRLLRDKPGSFDLALVDMTMPRMDGAETLREMHRCEPSLPLVLMSGHTQSDATSNLSDVVLSGFLQKPFRMPAVREILDAVAKV